MGGGRSPPCGAALRRLPALGPRQYQKLLSMDSFFVADARAAYVLTLLIWGLRKQTSLLCELTSYRA